MARAGTYQSLPCPPLRKDEYEYEFVSVLVLVLLKVGFYDTYLWY
jgi:hypothetical protein